MSQQKLLKAEEVAFLVGCSIHTLNLWYRFKKNNPDSEYAKMLPEFIQSAPLQKRYWTQESVDDLIAFQTKLPKGRNGVMGNTSRKYYGGNHNGKGRKKRTSNTAK